MISRERLQNTFLDLIAVYSPSKKEKNMVQWLETYLKSRNISYKKDHAGEKYGGNGCNLVAHIPGTISGSPIGFMAHMDQIEPCDNIKPQIEGNIIKTDGTTTLGGDDKSGIASILEAVEDLLESKKEHRDIYLAFTCSEEISMMGTKNMDLSILPCKDLVVPDATGETGIIAYKAPAMDAITIEFYGKKAHAGIEPEKGINAIVTASKAISKMRIGRIDKETTSNLGRIDGGGATNIVTDHVSVSAEIRSHDLEKLEAEKNHMRDCCEQAAKKMKADYKFICNNAYPALSVDLDSEIVNVTKEAMIKEDVTPDLQVIGGGSDANVLAAHGYRSVILGVGMKDVHTVEESLDIDDLVKATKIINHIMCADR